MSVGPDDYQNYAETVTRYGLVTTPTAGAVIVTSGDLMRGLWHVKVQTSYGGTADVADNMELWVGPTKKTTLPVLPVVNGVPQEIILDAVRVEDGQEVQVRCVAAGGAGSVYRATMQATAVSTLALT